MYVFLLAALALLALGGLMLHSNLAALERRALEFEEQNARAHARLANHQRQLDALGREMGWVDDHAHTKMLTGKLPIAEPPEKR